MWKQCAACGTNNPPEFSFCQRCGQPLQHYAPPTSGYSPTPPLGYTAPSQQYGQPAQQPPPLIVYRTPRRNGRTVGVIIAVVVILIVILVIALSFHSGTIDITVSHVGISTISTSVTVDGSTIWNGNIPPQQQWTDAYTVNWFWGGCSSYTVVAYGSGGLAGPTTDSQTIDVCSGGSAQVSLSV